MHWESGIYTRKIIDILYELHILRYLVILWNQAMFRAIGVGHAQSLSSAAAMNWVLKDGLGRLSRCIYTACVGSAFDTNLKVYWVLMYLSPFVKLNLCNLWLPCLSVVTTWCLIRKGWGGGGVLNWQHKTETNIWIGKEWSSKRVLFLINFFVCDLFVD